VDNDYFEKYGYPPFYEDERMYQAMTNKRQFLNDLELEERITGMSDRELMEFTARQTYDVCNLARNNEQRIELLEKRGNKFIAVVGAVGTFIGAIIIAIINYFAGK